jgi:hypothetical protein
MGTEDTRELCVPKVVVVIASGVLALGIAPMPYGYYTILRIIACAVFAWSAIVTGRRKHETLPWVFALIAILFNPIVRVHLDRTIWMWANLAAAVLLLGTTRHTTARR